MTDEELAEEYAKANVHYEVAKRENGTEYAKEVSSVTVKEAFLAGLRAGKLQWHDLRKNPKDLPPNEHEVYVAIDIEIARKRKLIYGFDRYLSDSECWFNESEQGIIAWCEIPKFEDFYTEAVACLDSLVSNAASCLPISPRDIQTDKYPFKAVSFRDGSFELVNVQGYCATVGWGIESKRKCGVNTCYFLKEIYPLKEE